MKTLMREELNTLLKGWSRRYRVMAPVVKENGECLFDEFLEEGLAAEYGKLPLSPKSAFFPHSEAIFQVEENRYRQRISTGKTLLFGIRPCDMTGILQLESFMTRGQRDNYFSARREAATIVVMACPGPLNDNCFCAAMESGPVVRKGFDLQFYDMGDRFLIEVGSEKGREALASIPLPDMEDPSGEGKIAAFRQAAIGKFNGSEAVVEAMQRLKEDRDEAKVWDYFGQKCVMCGGCAFVCPTCTCFNVHDQLHDPGNGFRIRTWDACLLGGFTREASGHNPRPNQASRLKRRYEHKLRYYNEADRQGALSGCTGCGRCSDYCPVHIGTLEIARAIAE